MIISKTPLRISFLGGGSDFRAHFTKHGGAVLSAAIDKYIYVTVSPSFDNRVHLHYSRIEVVDSAEQLQHDIVRAALRQAGISRGIEIHTIADVTGEGTGLGSSSALAVGLVNALTKYKYGYPRGEMQLAQRACQIEIDMLGKPIGEQDQYIATYGGFRLFEWSMKKVNESDSVTNVKSELAALGIQNHVLLFDTRIKRNAHEILTQQQSLIPNMTSQLSHLAQLAREGYEALFLGEYEKFGELVHQGWLYKRTLANNIANPLVDSLYEHARIAGAWGGKICGAGGGGYLLLIAPPEKHEAIRGALGLAEMRVRLGVEGSVVREI